MAGVFGGWTAQHYGRFRRDVPDVVIGQLADRFALTGRDRVLDIGVGTGQLLIPLVRRVGSGVGIDPQPELLAQLRHRASKEHLPVEAVQGLARDITGPAAPLHLAGLGVTAVANALHWMDPAQVFNDVRDLLRPGGGIAVVSHGIPL